MFMCVLHLQPQFIGCQPVQRVLRNLERPVWRDTCDRFVLFCHVFFMAEAPSKCTCCHHVDQSSHTANLNVAFGCARPRLLRAHSTRAPASSSDMLNAVNSIVPTQFHWSVAAFGARAPA